MPMHRTQVYFPQEMYEFLMEEAEEKEVTLAHTIRKKIKETMPKLKKKRQKKKMSGADFLLKMANDAERLGFEGPKDLATNPDKYLYGNT